MADELLAGHPFVVAHRGASAARPEHTLAAYDLALKAILTLMQLGAVPADANRRYLASLPARKAN